jgi:glycosyltransferase involved in cell wall biosynthesis
VRVAYVLGTSAGGTARHVRMLAGGLARRGVTVSVYGPASTWAAAGEPGVPGLVPGFTAVEIADRPRPSRDVAAVRRLRALFASAHPDVVHAHGMRAGALAALAVGGAAARPRLVVTVHNAAPSGGLGGAVYRLLEHLVARRADQVLCVSGDLESRMRGLRARRVARALVPAPPAPAGASDNTLAMLRAELGAGGEPRPPIVLTVARLAPQKGLDTLIDAAGRWHGRDPAPILAIAGEGPLEAELARRATAAGANARFLGRRDDVPALMAAADVFALPSVWEGQPLVVQEALRAGLPLVASRVGGIPDLTGPDAALLVPPGDAAALAGAVASVLGDPGLATRLSEAAVKQAQTLPTERDALDAALAGYQALLDMRPGGADVR